MTSVPLGPRPPRVALMALPSVTVARITFAPPMAVSAYRDEISRPRAAVTQRVVRGDAGAHQRRRLDGR